jgi:hypothetical protein
MNKILQLKINEVKNLCKLYKVKNLYAFGSVVGNNFTDKSDIDFLLSFIEDISIEEYTDNYFSLHYKLRELFNRDIDIITEKMLSNPYFIESINKSRVLIYE